MKKLFAVTFALATLTGPVHAQFQSKQQTPLQAEDAQKKQDAERTEREYQAAMKKTQGQGGDKTVVDPWANMRAIDGSQPKR